MRNFIKLPIILSLLVVMTLSLCAFDDQQQKVYDNANLLTNDEEDLLLEKILDLDYMHDLDIVIVTIDDAEGLTSQEYAENFYADGNFGYDSYRSGSLLLIDMDNRDVYVTTEGNAISEINDAEVEKILDNIFVYLQSEEYYNACDAYLDTLSECYISSDLDNVSREDYLANYSTTREEVNDWLSPVFGPVDTSSGAKVLRNPIISGIIAAVISIIIVAIISMKRKTKMTAGNITYMDKDSFTINHRNDVFTGRTTTSHRIDSDSGSHGGSSHIGGGGMSHGGGGRSF